MKWRPDKYQALQHDLAKGNVDPQVREELEHHLASRIEENVARGMTREAAEREARTRFGDVDRYRSETAAEERRTQADTGRRERLVVARQEVRRAWRALVRNPGFSVAAIFTLGIGIAAAVAVFSVLDAVVLRPLPYPGADRLVRIYHPVPKVGPGQRWNISTAEYFHFQKESRTLESVGLFGGFRIAVVADGPAQQVNAGRATETTISLLGGRPLLGRLFAADDGRPDANNVLLSERFWRLQYAASPDVIGRTIRLEGSTSRIVGVVAGDIDLPDWRVDLWVPFGLDPAAPARNFHIFKAVARLRPGVTAEDASQELAAMVPGYLERFPSAYTRKFFDETSFTTVVVPWKADVVGDANETLWVVFAAAGLVLLIAAVNVGNLFLVRGQAVRQEIAVRSLLGAGRSQLAWHHFAESGVVAIAAVTVGLFLSWGGLQVFLAAVPVGLSGNAAVAIPRLAEVALGGTGVGLAVALGVLAFLVFGAVSFLAQPGPNEGARAGRGLTATRRDAWLRSTLVVAQVSLAVVLLAAAGLMLRTLEQLRSIEPGFDPSGVLVANLALPFNTYQKYERTTSFYRALVEQVEAIPGVRSAGVGSELPVEAGDGCSLFEYPSRPAEVNTACLPNAVVGPGYFTTLGISLDGRDLEWRDLDTKSGAAVLSDALARRLFDDKALDQAINGPNKRDRPPYRVAGVTRSLRWHRLDQPPPEVAFFPLEPIPETWLWSPPARMALVVKVPAGEPTAIVPAIRRIVQTLDPEVVMEQIRTMDDVVAGSLLRIRLVTVLLAVSAAAALLLSVIGLYGAIAYSVTRRTREIGVRIAVGAPAARVRGEIVRQALRMTAGGLAIGLVGALMLGRMMQSLLFGVHPADPVTLGAVTVTLSAVAIVASLVPAARAAAIDPVAALRSD